MSAPVIGDGPVVLSFDVGGTATKSALVDASGRIVDLRRTPTPRSAGDPAGAIAGHLAGLAASYRAAHRGLVPVAAGVSVPGLVDEDAGVAVFSGNLGWRDAPIRELAAQALGMPVAFGHDVRAAGLAEHRWGAAAGHRDAVVVVIGTGIASAILIDGTPLVGGGFAGEIGHVVADPEGDPCPCGGVGCLETVASAGAIARRYARAAGAPVDGAREVLHALRAGDPRAQKVWDEAVEALAREIVRQITVLAPGVVVIGGGLAEAGDDLFLPLRGRVAALLTFQRRCEIVRAGLGEDAGLIGTALRARLLAGERGA
ncbi:ROK family protein [Microbacterium sp. zg.Y1090]|uniref:ROK family protein n=1 Tax=Microbacterium TaxID=33882 RepID=UPI00214B8B2A|nr:MULTISPECIES: ROK family protein [unclassified Microbacterium]MCR2812369.1 ROK family protein [Microbacterium sp. zg.Y1084]MCR2817830.1 ROK family protein [Microbacterium sp. zg.Y1090]MDL5485526.1 ROK family protein [Microbacterium sp. zg-Y1211]WIM28698.1 ROK family protein [Microbacterium sp. zg-Y1090]